MRITRRIMRRPTAKLILACLALGLTFASPALQAQQNVHATLAAPSDRKPAPPFRLLDASGKPMQVPDYKGKVVALNFWATDCGGCKMEIPGFIELQQAYKDKGFTVLGIATDITYSNLTGPEQAWKQVTPFVATNHMNYPILMADDAVERAYAMQNLPATLLVDKSGRVAATYVGVVNKDDVESNIKKLLAEP